MKKEKNHINGKEFRKYLGNRMNDAERNHFERKLQKDPFAAEAVEGFEHTTADNLEKDIAEIKSRIRNTKRRSVIGYWAAAATVLLLVTAGLLWYQLLYNEPPTSEMAVLDVEKQEEIVAPAVDTVEEKDTTHKLLQEAENKSEKAAGTDQKTEETTTGKTILAQQEKTEIIEKKSTEPSGNKMLKRETLAGKPKAAAVARDSKAVSFDLHPHQAASPLRVTLNSLAAVDPETIKVTRRTGFPIDSNDVFPDSFQTIPAKERERIQEIQGVDIQDKVEVESDMYLTDVDAYPKGGMQNFLDYMEMQAVLPPGYPSKKETVKLLLNIDSQGKIVGIQARDKADSLLVKRSETIIKNGPKWNPKVVNGEKIQSEVKLKIVFRKK